MWFWPSVAANPLREAAMEGSDVNVNVVRSGKREVGRWVG